MMATAIKPVHMAHDIPLPSPQASLVGNSFVSQYYYVLYETPQAFHRFYTDESTFTRAEAGVEGAVFTVMGQRAIHDKVMEFEGLDWKAEIKTVDSQFSLTGSVLVIVTGSMLINGLSRDFVQSFFLAPQEKGYFVLNDILRYVGDAEPPHQPSRVSLQYANGVAESAPHVVDQPLSDTAAVPISHVIGDAHVVEREFAVEAVSEIVMSSIDTSASIMEESHQTRTVDEEEESNLVLESAPPPLAAAELISNSPEEAGVPQFDSMEAPSSTVEPPSSEEVSGAEKPKLSYAAMLRQRDSGGGMVVVTPPPVSGGSVAYIKPAPPCNETPTHVLPVAAAPAPVDRGLSSVASESIDESLNPDAEVDGRSIFVKNLPPSITTAQLEEELSQFGAVKPGGINIKGQGQKVGNCYAFVEFEEQSSAHSAIEASPLQIMGKQVSIEEKKPLGRGRGRAGVVRGERPFRSLRPGQFGPGRGRGLVGDRDRDRDMGRGDRDMGRGGRGGGLRGGMGMNMAGGMQSGMGGDGPRRVSSDVQGGPRQPRRNTQQQQIPRTGGGGIGRGLGASATPV